MSGLGQHISVLREEAVSALNIIDSGFYVDATYGRGGHSQVILQSLGSDGRLLALDQDWQAIEHAQGLSDSDKRFSISPCNFSEIRAAVAGHDALGKIDGVLFDLGVSSPQLDQAERGFSFDKDGPLDMRMDQRSGEPVSQWLTSVDKDTLAMVFKEYGEERYARRIAGRVVEAFAEKPVTTTRELAEIIKAAHPRWEKHKHPATRCFQALRIVINRELDSLKVALDSCVEVLRPGGRLVVISFHSLEDRIVKRFLKGSKDAPVLPRGLPVIDADNVLPFKSIGRAIKPSAEEVAANPRARSSIMRVAEKVA